MVGFKGEKLMVQEQQNPPGLYKGLWVPSHISKDLNHSSDGNG